MSIRKYLLFCFMALFLVASSADGGEVRRGKIDPAHVTVLGLTPGVHTLADVMRTLGPAEAYYRGRGEHRTTMLCYVSGGSDDDTRVLFTAGPDGKRGLLRSIRILSGRVRFDKAERCAASEKISADTGTSGGLRLGLSPAQVKRILGKADEEAPGRLEYRYYFHRKKMSEEEIRAREKLFPHIRKYPSYYETSKVEARFHQGRAVRLDLSRMETSYRK